MAKLDARAASRVRALLHLHRTSARCHKRRAQPGRRAKGLRRQNQSHSRRVARAGCARPAAAWRARSPAPRCVAFAKRRAGGRIQRERHARAHHAIGGLFAVSACVRLHSEPSECRLWAVRCASPIIGLAFPTSILLATSPRIRVAAAFAVFSSDMPVEQVSLGLYLVRGDNM